jgi:hypothetical protein
MTRPFVALAEPNDADESIGPGHREVLRAASGAVFGGTAAGPFAMETPGFVRGTGSPGTRTTTGDRNIAWLGVRVAGASAP